MEPYEQPDHHGEKKTIFLPAEFQLFETSFQLLYCLSWLYVLVSRF